MAKVTSWRLNLYTETVQNELTAKQARVCAELVSITERLVAYIAPQLSNPKAKEYLLHGVCRRVNVIRRSLENIFQLFPPSQNCRLQKDLLEDLQINLHAFLINTHGVLDNIAWVSVLERGAYDLTMRRRVGLFKSTTRCYLSSELLEYLNRAETVSWFHKYATNYRDALAHRIPSYIPPFSLTDTEAELFRRYDQLVWEHLQRQDFELMKEAEQARDALGSVCPTFLHSFSEADSSPVNIHYQTTKDAEMVAEISDIFCRTFNSPLKN